MEGGEEEEGEEEDLYAPTLLIHASHQDLLSTTLSLPCLALRPQGGKLLLHQPARADPRSCKNPQLRREHWEPSGRRETVLTSKP